MMAYLPYNYLYKSERVFSKKPYKYRRLTGCYSFGKFWEKFHLKNGFDDRSDAMCCRRYCTGGEDRNHAGEF